MFIRYRNYLACDTFRRQISKTIFLLKRQNHYDVLQVPVDCSPKEIRAAYIKLSKKLHPDLNKTKNTNKDFIRLTEAYQVLSDPVRRRNYDLSLSSTFVDPSVTEAQRVRTVYDMYPSDFPKAGGKQTSSEAYYGIKGVKKVSNFWIVILCLIFTSIGVGLQAMAIRHSVTLKRNQLDITSQENAKILAAVRAEAAKNGIDLQLERLQQKAEMEMERIYGKPPKN